MVRGVIKRRPEGRPSVPGLNRRSGRIPALPYPPIKRFHCTAASEIRKAKNIHSGKQLR